MSTTTPMSTINSANFNNNNIASVPGVTILGSDNYSPAKRSLISYDMARSSKSTIASSNYNDKVIGVRIGISRDTRALVEQALDAVLALLQEPEADLLLKQSGGLRRYQATYYDYTIQTAGTAYMEITLIFKTSDHFGYDTYPTELLNVTGQTSNNRSDLINVGGSARWQTPVITLVISAVTGGTSKTIQIGNGNTNQVISITRTFATGDVIVIDPLNQSVKVNGSEVAFTGAHPEWKVGYGYLTMSHQFTTVTYNLKAIQYRRWI